LKRTETHGLKTTTLEGGELLELGGGGVEGSSATLVDSSREVIHLRVVFTPGHTDGHMSLFDDSTKLLVAGDHVVGLGSALLDPRGGGDMTDYLQTCRNMI
jgi:glyoxylase-like metal-dependent hydrolase (beta-lactamase superfamily II)